MHSSLQPSFYREIADPKLLIVVSIDQRNKVELTWVSAMPCALFTLSRNTSFCFSFCKELECKRSKGPSIGLQFALCTAVRPCIEMMGPYLQTSGLALTCKGINTAQQSKQEDPIPTWTETCGPILVNAERYTSNHCAGPLPTWGHFLMLFSIVLALGCSQIGNGCTNLVLQWKDSLAQPK
jgi:hypothetical protein